MRSVLIHLRRLTSGFLTVVLLVAIQSPAHAVDVRIIDIAQVTWPGAPAPSVTLSDIQNSLTAVEANWKSYTTIEGDTKDRAIDFIYGTTLSTSIELKSRFQCDALDFSSYVNTIRFQTYTRSEEHTSELQSH